MDRDLLKEFRIRCYAELNDFLPSRQRQKSFVYALKTPVAVEEVIESLGIPRSEVDLVLVNSQPALFSQRLFEHDHISIYPTFGTLDISSLKDAVDPPLRTTRFILDAHLGKLAKYLRMLGFDSLYRNDYKDREIIQQAAEDGRIILSRDRQLLTSKEVTHGYYVRSVDKHDQLREVVRKYDLYNQFRSFTRCMTCNNELVPKDKEEIGHLVPCDTAKHFNEFFFCPDCRKVFWKGSHFQRMEALIRDLT